MSAPLAGGETLLLLVDAHAEETSRFVEVEVVSRQFVINAEKLFHLHQLFHRTTDEVLSADEVELVERKIPQPHGHVPVVDGSSDGLVGPVDLPGDRMYGQVFEPHVVLAPVQSGGVNLHVVGDGSVDGVTYDQQQLEAGIHAVDPCGHRLDDEIGGSLFDRDLIGVGVGHPAAIPVQSKRVVVVVIEEVDFLLVRLNRRMEVEELEEGSRSALADSDDEALRQAPLGEAVPDGLWE